MRELHHVEVINNEDGLRQRLTDRGLEDRAHVDRDVAHCVTPGLAALPEPVGHGLGGAALDLPEQSLPAGQVAHADVPPVHAGLPCLADLVEHPLRPAPPGLVDPEDLDRAGLGGQHHGRVRGERRRDHRPRHIMVTGRLHDRAPTVGDRGARRRAQPCGHPMPGRDLRYRLGERPSRTRLHVAPPPAFDPPQLQVSASDRQVPGPGDPPALRPRRPDPALRAASGLFIRGNQMHDRPVDTVVDPHHGQAVKTQQPRRILNHARGFSAVIGLPRQQA
jgi:hypothetical protein